LGHPCGDELLKLVARRLEACIRQTDMVARFGGDEFAILLDAIQDTSDAVRVAEKVQKASACVARCVQAVAEVAAILVVEPRLDYER
jgi:diguanylate cyclase (GGDEF)-like protein